jgi:hypothetical protein
VNRNNVKVLKKHTTNVRQVVRLEQHEFYDTGEYFFDVAVYSHTESIDRGDEPAIIFDCKNISMASKLFQMIKECTTI